MAGMVLGSARATASHLRNENFNRVFPAYIPDLVYCNTLHADSMEDGDAPRSWFAA